jgi:hypothetical protein
MFDGLKFRYRMWKVKRTKRKFFENVRSAHTDVITGGPVTITKYTTRKGEVGWAGNCRECRAFPCKHVYQDADLNWKPITTGLAS